MSFLDELKALLHKAHDGITAEEAKLKAWIGHLGSHVANGGVISAPPQAGVGTPPAPGTHGTPVLADPPPADTTPAPLPNPQRATPVALPAGCTAASVPGTLGLVHFVGPCADPKYQAAGYAIDEVADAYPEGSPERDFVKRQVSMADELQNLGEVYESCRAIAADGRATGENIPGTVMCATKKGHGEGEKFRTVAEAYAFYSTYSPVTSGDFAHP